MEKIYTSNYWNRMNVLSIVFIIYVACPELSQTFSPSKDSFVRASSYASENYGADVEFFIKESGLGDNTRNSYRQFDLSSISGTVSDATLRLFVTTIQGQTNITTTVEAYAVSDDSWVEGTGTIASPASSGLTWSNAPALGNLLTSGLTGTLEGAWMELDVTSFIDFQVNGDGIATIALTGLSGEDRTVKFSSGEGTNAPELVAYRLLLQHLLKHQYY